MGQKLSKKFKINEQTRLHTFFLNPYENERFTRCPKMW